MSEKRPAIQFYIGDWRKDPCVSVLTIASRGLWWEMIMLMHESPIRGYLLTTSGRPMTEQQLARSTGVDVKLVRSSLQEMHSVGTFSRNEGGTEWHIAELPPETIVCRRMVRDAKLSQVRKIAGSKGGNPLLLQDRILVNQNGTKTEANGLPASYPQALPNSQPKTGSSSSSSSSSSEKTVNYSSSSRDVSRTHEPEGGGGQRADASPPEAKPAPAAVNQEAVRLTATLTAARSRIPGARDTVGSKSTNEQAIAEALAAGADPAVIEAHHAAVCVPGLIAARKRVPDCYVKFIHVYIAEGRWRDPLPQADSVTAEERQARTERRRAAQERITALGKLRYDALTSGDRRAALKYEGQLLEAMSACA